MFDFLQQFGWQFKRKDEDESHRAQFIRKEDPDSHTISQRSFGYNVYEANLDQRFNTENDLIKKYRSMALHPEIDAAVTEIINESIAAQDYETPVEIVLDEVEMSESIKKKITDEFNYILRLLNFKSKSSEIFKRWYIDGRLYFYMIPSQEATKEGLEEIRYIPPFNIKKIRKEDEKVSGQGISVIDKVEEYFIYNPQMNIISNNNTNASTGSNLTGIKLSKDSVCYITSGNSDEPLLDTPTSHLHKAIRPTNQLRMLEDATIIYRLSRAPERRIFYVDVGNMPKGKADEHMKSIRDSLTNKIVYNQNTGELKDQTQNLSMMEDIFLPRKDGSRGTEVSSLPAGQNLGQIEDLEYFKKILYMALNVPYSRMMTDQAAMFSLGRASEISREEVKFSKFIDGLRMKFSNLFLEILRTQLLLKRIISESDWERIKENIQFHYASDNYFKELKEAEILRERLSLARDMDDYVGKYFSKEDVMKKALYMTDSDIEELEKQLQKEAPEEEEDPFNSGEGEDDIDSEDRESERIKNELLRQKQREMASNQSKDEEQ